MSVIFYPEIIEYALGYDKIVRRYYPYLMKALRKLEKGTYERVKTHLLRKVKAAGLKTETFNEMVERLKKVQYTDFYLIVIEFDHNFRKLLEDYGVSGMESGIYYAFAFRVKKILGKYKGELREKMFKLCLTEYKTLYYCKEEILRKIIEIVSKYYKLISKELEKRG